MIAVNHNNFHILEKIKPGVEKAFILSTWKPEKDIYIIGAAIGLLCIKSTGFELYLSISKSPQTGPTGKASKSCFLLGLKKDWLFYQQRDVYTYSTGINDLMSYEFLPSNHGFLIKQGEPIYIKVGVVNGTRKTLEYDAFCNIYYK